MKRLLAAGIAALAGLALVTVATAQRRDDAGGRPGAEGRPPRPDDNGRPGPPPGPPRGNALLDLFDADKDGEISAAELENAVEALRRAADRAKSDLELAARVQATFLPRDLPADPRYRVAWRYLPCDQLAGDALGTDWTWHHDGPERVTLVRVKSHLVERNFCKFEGLLSSSKLQSLRGRLAIPSPDTGGVAVEERANVPLH